MRLDQLGKFHKRPLGSAGAWKDRGNCGWHVITESKACGAMVSRNGKYQSVNAGGRKGILIAIKDGSIESSMWWVCDEHHSAAMRHNAGSEVYEVDRYLDVTLLNEQHMYEVSFRFYTQNQDTDNATVQSRAQAALDHTMLQDHGDHWEYLKVIGE